MKDQQVRNGKRMQTDTHIEGTDKGDIQDELQRMWRTPMDSKVETQQTKKEKQQASLNSLKLSYLN